MLAVIGVLLALVPGFAWLFFYLQEDPHPEPVRSIVRTFVAGIGCAFVALAIQIGLSKVGVTLDTAFPLWKIAIGLLVFSFTEETVKFGAAYASVHHDPAFDEPVDGMIYMIVAALGFATIENIGAIQGNLLAGGTAGILETLTFRFVGATLLHTITAGIIGYAWAESIRKFQIDRIPWSGIFAATILHAIFNAFILVGGTLMYAVIFAVVVGLFVLNDFEVLRTKSV